MGRRVPTEVMFEDLITAQPASAFAGFRNIGESFGRGMELAQRGEQLRIAREELQERTKQNRLENTLKAVELIPKMKLVKGPAKKMVLGYVMQHLEAAGSPLPQSVFDQLNGSDEDFKSYTSAIDQFKQQYLQPGQEDYVGFQAALADLNQRVGADPAFVGNVAESVKLQQQASAKEREERAKTIEKMREVIGKAAPSQQFLDTLDTTKSPEEGLIRLRQFEDTKRQLEELDRTFFLNPARQKAISSNEMEKAEVAKADIQNLMSDSSTIGEAQKRMNDLRGILSKAVTGGAVASSEEEKRKSELKQAYERSGLVGKEVEFVQKTNKNFIEKMQTAERVLNILNDPKLANSSVGTDAVITLVARFLDPKTGVKEAEQQRISAALFGGVPARFEAFLRGIAEGRTLKPEQQDMLRRLVLVEIKNAKQDIANIRSTLGEKLRGTEIEPDTIVDLALEQGRSVKTIEKAINDFERLGGNLPKMPGAIPKEIGSEYKKAYDEQGNLIDPNAGGTFERWIKKAFGGAKEAVGAGKPAATQPAPQKRSALSQLSILQKAKKPEVSGPPAPQASEVMGPPAPSRSELEKMSDQELFKLWKQKQSER